MPEKYLTDRHLRLPDGTFPHMGVSGGDVARYVLLCGDPERVERIRERLEGVKAVGRKRGYLVYTGTYHGVPVSVASSGVGSPSMAIAIEELGAVGAQVFVRVGSCASIQPEVDVGRVILATAAVRDEGTSHYYAPTIFPAVADHEVVASIRRAADELGIPCSLGIVRSTDSFYEGERKREVIDQWRARKVLAFEMESSALFTVATVLGYRSGSILVPGSNLIQNVATYRGEATDLYRAGIENAIGIALGAARNVVSKV